MKPRFETVFVGIAALLLLLYEWDFGRRARVGRAVVVESTTFGRSGITIADVWHLADERRVRATLRAWFCHLRRGQEVGVLYLPDDPGNLIPDWYWERHHGSTIAVAAFSALAATEALRFRAGRRLPALSSLREDFEGPSARSGGTPLLSIDTTPRLWDRDLDG